MNAYRNARLTPKGRELLIARLERGEHVCDVACALGVSVRTIYKWKKRYREHGLAGLQDSSLHPLASPARTSAALEEQVVLLRKQRRTFDKIAEQTGISRATVGRILMHHGLNRWRDLEPREPVIRYERDHPGEMVHIDINPIEQIFSKIKHWMRMASERTVEVTWKRVGKLIGTIKLQECQNYFINSGYAST